MAKVKKSNLKMFGAGEDHDEKFWRRELAEIEKIIIKSLVRERGYCYEVIAGEWVIYLRRKNVIRPRECAKIIIGQIIKFIIAKNYEQLLILTQHFLQKYYSEDYLVAITQLQEKFGANYTWFGVYRDEIGREKLAKYGLADDVPAAIDLRGFIKIITFRMFGVAAAFRPEELFIIFAAMVKFRVNPQFIDTEYSARIIEQLFSDKDPVEQMFSILLGRKDLPAIREMVAARIRSAKERNLPINYEGEL